MSHRRDEYSTSTHRTKEIAADKNALYQNKFPLPESKAVVDRYFDKEKFSHLAYHKNKELIYLVTPSTSRENILPKLLADKLQQNYGGQVVDDFATPVQLERTAKKGIFQKLAEPPQYKINDERVANLPNNAVLVLVDDVVTTGMTQRALRDGLAAKGHQVSEVVSLGQSEVRKISPRDIDRLVGHIGEDQRQDITQVLNHYSLKHYANYIEQRIAKENNPTLIEDRTFLREYFRTEAQRLQSIGLSQAAADQHIGKHVGADQSLQSGSGTKAGMDGRADREGVPLRAGQDPTESKMSTRKDSYLVIIEQAENSTQQAPIANVRVHDVSTNEKEQLVRTALGIPDRTKHIVHDVMYTSVKPARAFLIDPTRDTDQDIIMRMQFSEPVLKGLQEPTLKTIKEGMNPNTLSNTLQPTPITTAEKLQQTLSQLDQLRVHHAKSTQQDQKKTFISDGKKAAEKLLMFASGGVKSLPFQLNKASRQYVEGKIDREAMRVSLATSMVSVEHERQRKINPPQSGHKVG